MTLCVRFDQLLWLPLTAVIQQLAFTRPNSGWEVGPLNLTQEHKSVWYGPPSKATGHAPRPARDWPVPLSYHRPARRRACELRPQAIVPASPVGTFSTSAILRRFPNFYTLRVEILPMFFIRSRLPMTLRAEKSFMKIGLHVFQKSGTQTHTHRQTDSAILYIYRSLYWIDHWAAIRHYSHSREAVADYWALF